jgi:curved DNA-binding protein CbpA
MPVEWKRVEQEIGRINRANGNHIMVLNLSRGWTEKDLKRSYRRICLVLHPDRHPTVDDARKKKVSDYFAIISASNRLLTDSLKNGASPAFASFTSSFNSSFTRATAYQTKRTTTKKASTERDPYCGFGNMFGGRSNNGMGDVGVFRSVNVLFSARLGTTSEQEEKDREAKRKAAKAEKRRKEKTIPSKMNDLSDMWEEARKNRK